MYALRRLGQFSMAYASRFLVPGWKTMVSTFLWSLMKFLKMQKIVVLKFLLFQTIMVHSYQFTQKQTVMVTVF